MDLKQYQENAMPYFGSVVTGFCLYLGAFIAMIVIKALFHLSLCS